MHLARNNDVIGNLALAIVHSSVACFGVIVISPQFCFSQALQVQFGR